MNQEIPQEAIFLYNYIKSKIPNHVSYPDWSKTSFLQQLPECGTILDVGCGTNSPTLTKHYLPKWHYVGIDVQDYNQTLPNVADEYVLTTSHEFCGKLLERTNSANALISSHNLEHCENRTGTLRAMAQALKVGGKMYLSFPCQESVNFSNNGNVDSHPVRAGTLNYFDDPTHRDQPPDFSEVIGILYQEGIKITYANTRFSPPLEWIIGLYNEESSVRDLALKPGTWQFWGFETVIWAFKPIANL